MDALLKSWANSFLYRSIGDKFTYVSESFDEEALQLNYKVNCEKPIRKLNCLSDDTKVTGKIINSFITKLNTTPLCNCIHVLPVLAKYEGTIEEVVDQFLQEHEPVYATCNGTNTFVTYVDKSGEIIGDYPSDLGMTSPLCLGLKSNFKNPLDLRMIKNRSPVTLNDYAINALRILYEADMVELKDLRSDEFPMMRNGKCVLERVYAVTDGLPSYFVRNLINTLPKAYSADYENVYAAALNWAVEHPYEHGKEIEELKRILNYEGSSGKAELTDDDVIKYIHEKYGISVDSIRSQLLVPTAEKLYTSSYLLKGENKDLSAEEFIDLVNSNPMAATGTLDEIIEGFCEEEGFSKDCTVQNLIDFINDVPFHKKDIKDYLAEEVKEKNLDPMTPITYYLSDTVYDVSAEKSLALGCVNKCPAISEDMKSSIQKAMLEGKALESFNMSDELEKLNLPADIYDALLQYIVLGKEFVLPKQEITAEDVTSFLVEKGFPRVTVNSLLQNGLDSVVKDRILSLGYDMEFYEKLQSGSIDVTLSEERVFQYLESSGVDVKILECVKNKTPWDENATVSEYLKKSGLTDDMFADLVNKKQQSRSIDLAYSVAESLLYDARQFLGVEDTYPRRVECDPLWYSFLRVAAMENTDEGKVETREFLEKKKDGASPAMVEIIDRAIALMGGDRNEEA